MSAGGGPRAGAPRAVVAALESAGARVCIVLPERPPLQVGSGTPLAEIRVRCTEAAAALERLDVLRLAEHYLEGDIDVEGDLLEVLKAATALPLAGGWTHRGRLALRLLLRRRDAYDRESIAFHYDRPPGFFLPWLGRWRCYSHGLYAGPDDDLDRAMARKMQAAIDALGLEPGMEVLDMGAGWGCFVEYAGLQGIRVRAITISREQQRFVEALIRERGLPCSVELVNFRAYRPPRPLDGAVFLGTFEHVPEYDRAAAFLERHLAPGARVWADFCAQHRDFTLGPFMKRYVWPGPIRYVDPAGLVRAFVRCGFNVHEMRDDTLHYARTVRDWGDRLERERNALAEEFGEPAVRAFLLFLRGSVHFLERNLTQAYHLVAAREPAPFVAR